jgi:hypothetical protein
VHHQPLISERLLGLKKEQRPKRKKTENQFNNSLQKKGKSFFPVEKTREERFCPSGEKAGKNGQKDRHRDTELCWAVIRHPEKNRYIGWKEIWRQNLASNKWVAGFC